MLVTLSSLIQIIKYSSRSVQHFLYLNCNISIKQTFWSDIGKTKVCILKIISYMKYIYRFFSIFIKSIVISQAWQLIFVILELGKLRQRNHEFKASLDYIRRSRPLHYLMNPYLKREKGVGRREKRGMWEKEVWFIPCINQGFLNFFYPQPTFAQEILMWSLVYRYVKYAYKGLERQLSS